MKLFPIAIFIFISSVIHSQEVLLEYNTRMKSYDSYPITTDNGLALFLVEKDSVRGILFDKKFRIIDEMLVTRTELGYNHLLGGGFSNGIYQLYFTDNSKTNFYGIALDFTKKTIFWSKMPDLLGDATFLEAIPYNNQFHIFAVKRKSSILQIYRFDEDLKYEYWNIDCSMHDFAGTVYSKLSDVLRTSGGFIKLTSNSFRVDEKSPPTIELTSGENKIYTRDNKFIVTMDNEHHNTKILTIDMKDFTYGLKNYDKGKIECAYSTNIQSNSFLFRDLLFQANICSDELVMQIRDIRDGKLLKEFRTKKNEEISYRNSPLIEDGNITLLNWKGKEKELKDTRAFIRKVLSGKLGITAFQTPAGYEISLGSYVEVEHNSGGPSPFATNSGTVRPGYSFNNTMIYYQSYTESISTFFKTLLDSTTLNHIEGDLSPNSFDNINAFTRDSEKNILSETIFRYEDFYIYGYYNKSNKTYYLRKFD